MPVFDQASQNGDVRLYRAIGFASIQLTGFNLQTSQAPESISFTYQGSVPCATGSGATLLLSPSAAGPNVTGSSQTLQATLKDRASNPISGVSITFTVTGANATSGSATTNNSGLASFTYTAAKPGSDSAQASTTISSLNVLSHASLRKRGITDGWGRLARSLERAGLRCGA